MELTNEQRSALNQFRQQVSDILPKDKLEDDYYLLRWLRARKFVLSKSEAMLRNSMKVRKQYDVDNILTDSFQLPEVYKKYFPISTMGFDKQGNIIMMGVQKDYDRELLRKCTKRLDWIKFLFHLFESNLKKMEDNNKKTGLNGRKAWFIYDLEGMTIAHVSTRQAIEFFQDMATIAEQNYPEMLFKFMVLNVNKMTYAGFSLIRPFVADEIYVKLKFYAESDKSWKQVLLEEIDAGVLPKHWGGNRTSPDGDPKCPDVLCLGGKIPKEYYITPESVLSDLEGLESIVVNSGGTALVEAEIQVPGAYLKWVFGTDGHDIAFGLYRKTPQGLEEHLMKQRVDSHLFAEEGELECIETGTYVFAFDNSHSVVRSKTVKFLIQVAPAPEKN